MYIICMFLDAKCTYKGTNEEIPFIFLLKIFRHKEVEYLSNDHSSYVYLEQNMFFWWPLLSEAPILFILMELNIC